MPKNQRKKPKKKTIVEVDDNSWVTIRLPWWLLRAALLVSLALFVAVIVAMILSPDFASRVALAIIQLVGILSKSTK